MPKLCPCSSNKFYANCCKPYLTGKQIAPTPEALMRSRYTAFSKHQFSYLAKTMSGEAAKAFNLVAAKQAAPFMQWTKLEVIRTQEQGDIGVVEFAAHFRDNNQDGIIHEVSQFQKVEGQWFYIDGLHR
jgi:SEC-C motif-containing protein